MSKRAPIKKAAGSATPGKGAPRIGIDEAIERARAGRVDVTPAQAAEIAGKLVREGEYRQAEKVCRQMIAARPANADAHNILGVALQALGRGDDAIASLQEAARLAPKSAGVQSNLGELLRRAGRRDEAADALRRAVQLDQRNAQAWNNLGVVEHELGRQEAAIRCFRNALNLNGGMAEASNNLGNALRSRRELDAALEAYDAAIAARPDYAEAHNNRGAVLQQKGEFAAAEQALLQALRLNPRYVEAFNNLAATLSASRRPTEALAVLAQALKLVSGNPQSLLLAAKAQAQLNNLAVAEQVVRHVLARQPDNVEALSLLGRVLEESGRSEEALQQHERGIAIDPNNAEALNLYAIALKSLGRVDEARAASRRAIAADPTHYASYWTVQDIVDFSQEDALFRQAEQLLNANRDRPERSLPLRFAVAKALEDRGDPQVAMDAFIEAGRIKRVAATYDEAAELRRFDDIRSAFPKALFERPPFPGNPDERPVFIVGMPRSGSTLVEQILGSHSQVHAGGEARHLQQAIQQHRTSSGLPYYPALVKALSADQAAAIAASYLELASAGSGPAQRITNKLLANSYYVGLIALLFPNARFIHTVRDPLDTCVSAFTTLFEEEMPYSYDLAELGRFYAKYRELMAHWESVLPEGTMRQIVYEDLVNDPEPQARSLVEFLGLEWEQGCLEFHKSPQPVRTASMVQVREPIYTRSVDRWKRYGDRLKPLIEALDGKPKKSARTKAKADATA